MKHKKKLLALALLASTATGIAQASLFDRGNGLIYNDITQTTWAKDASLFQTQAADNINLVTDIIAANNGVIHDTPNSYDTVPNSGIYTLTDADFISDVGIMDWWGAQAWINYLNKTSYSGYNNWELPTTVPGTLGFTQTGSQMGELFYNELGGVADSAINTTHNANYNLYANVQDNAYWSGSEDKSIPGYALNFSTIDGFQNSYDKYFLLSAWAVRSGDAAAIPLPAAFWLFASGLMSLLGLKQRGNIG